MKNFTVCMLLCLLCGSAQAEVMGQMLARTANPTFIPSRSIEIGASRFTRQLQWLGLRFNRKTSSEVILYVDYANVQASNLPLSTRATAEFAGHGFGAGLVFPIDQRVLSGFEFALNLSSHLALLPQTRTSIPLIAQSKSQLLQQQSVVKLLVSPLDPVLENGLTWFFTVAYMHGDARVKLPSDTIKYRSTSELSIGAGLLLPLLKGQIFTGIEAVSENQLMNIGFRYPF